MNRPHILQIVGYKNAGKTTLLCELVRRLNAAGLRIGTVKQAHDHTIDREGTDSWRHRQAGAQVTAFASSAETAILHRQQLSLDALLAQMCAVAQHAPEEAQFADGGSHSPPLDLILVEGFKSERHAKLVLVRDAEDDDLPATLTEVVAVVLRAPAERLRAAWAGRPGPYPIFRADEPQEIADWIRGRIRAASREGGAS